MLAKKRLDRIRRRKRIRSKVHGIADCPRLSVFRSEKHIYAQLIDDDKGVTLVSFSTQNLKKDGKFTKTEAARLIGEDLAEIATKNKITKAVFDRGGYKYHGRVKSLAEGARSKGLKI